MSNQPDGFYYLHSNGDMIWKRFRPEQEPGGFVRRVWPVDRTDRCVAWIIVIEALALGAKEERIRELSDHWHLDTEDLPEFLVRYTHPTDEQRYGLRLFLTRIARVDADEWFDWLAATPMGEQTDLPSMPRPVVL